MDVRRWPLPAAVAALALCAGSTPLAHAQQAQASQDDTRLPEPEQSEPDPVDAKVRQLIRNADEWTGKTERAKRCQPSSATKDIVVCGETDPGAKYRVPADTEGRLATGGPPPAPDVAGEGIFRGKPTFSLPAPIPAYFIDFSKLPEVDQEYLKKAREAEAAELRRQQDAKDAKGGK